MFIFRALGGIGVDEAGKDGEELLGERADVDVALLHCDLMESQQEANRVIENEELY